jgi:flavin reductase (DIM6/NTAB) family NADH-FMN oxidoreductase RutF
VAPVTVFTAGAGAERAGLTVSSVLVSPGEPPELVAIIDPLSDLHRLAEESGRLLVHVLRVGEEKTASFFAGLYPVDPFAELGHSDTAYGPRLDGAGVVVAARFSSSQPAGFENLLRAEIDSIELPPGSESPLSWYRGRYRRLES